MSDDDEFHLCWFQEPVRMNDRVTEAVFYRHHTPLWMVQRMVPASNDPLNLELLEVLRYDKDKGTYGPATTARSMPNITPREAADFLRGITAIEFGSNMRETNNTE